VGLSFAEQQFPAEWRAYNKMKQRCYNSRVTGYKNWGGRGIIVCDRWFWSFRNFLNDMGLKPGPEYSLERKDNNGNYEPGNCKWATCAEQMKNIRVRSRKLTSNDVEQIRDLYRSGKYTMVELSDRFEVVTSTISRIVSYTRWKDGRERIDPIEGVIAGKDLFS
jgi:hypothetical protein